MQRCFAEIEAISLLTGDAKEDSIAYPRVLKLSRENLNLPISFVYIFE